MELTQAQLNSLQALTVSSGKIKTDNLAVGQQIAAKIAAVDPQNGEVTLKINDALVTAKTQLKLAVGETLQLTVALTNSNKVILQLPPTLLDSITQQKALREALPKQQPITDAIIQLKALIKLSSSKQLPTNIVDFAKKFVSKLPTTDQLSTSAGVKQAIRHSGVFLESKLSNIINSNVNNSNGNSKNFVEGDVKALLLGLKSVLLKEKSNLPGPQVTNKEAAKLSLPVEQKFLAPINNAAKQIQSNNQINTQAFQQTNTALLKSLANNSLQSLSLKNGSLTPLIKPTAYNQTNLNNAAITENTEQLKYKKILDSRAIEASITEVLKNTGNTVNSDKQLTDKQIQQILSNLLGQRKSPQNSAATSVRTGGLTTPPLAAPLSPEKAVATNLKPIQEYAGKENLTAKNEIAMSAIKSQHVNEASTPRLNNLVDLIETLIKQVDSAISRTQVHQLNTMVDQESGRFSLSMEIPVDDDENLHLVQLEIEKEQSKENETETVVTVNLAIDLNEIGPVYARITLVNDKTNIVLWAERDSTFHLVQESVDVLHLKLESSGLKSDGIACHHGQPPQSRFVKAENNNGLVDERA